MNILQLDAVKNFMQRYANAKKAVAQIRAGEWHPRYNAMCGAHLVAEHDNGLELWLGNGPLFCEIKSNGPNYFGLFWRHYVWYAAARRLRADTDGRAPCL